MTLGRTRSGTSIWSAVGSTFSQSLLQSQDEATSSDFYESLSEASQEERSSERYRYHLDSQLHGEAGLEGAWGGELDVSLAVRGGSDDERQRFATQAMRALGSQVTRTNRQFAQRAAVSEEEVRKLERVVSTQTFEQSNPADATRTIKYYQALQPYRAVMVLERIRLAYADGRTTELRELVDATRLLERAVVSDDTRAEVSAVLRRAAGEVTDCDGNRVSLLAGDGDRLELRRNPITRIRFVGNDGSEQELAVPGVAVRSEEFRVRTPHLLGDDA